MTTKLQEVMNPGTGGTLSKLLPVACSRNPSGDTLDAASQRSSYSNLDDDLTELMRNFPPTQPAPPVNPPDSAFSSSSSLGKRKASEVDLSLSSAAEGSAPPKKMSRTSPIADKDANPFLDGAKVVEDPYAPISFSPTRILQGIMDGKKIPYGVQYEIARCVSKGLLEFKNICVPDLDRLAELKTNEKAAPVTLKILVTGLNEEEDRFKSFFAKEHAAKFPWKELDREEGALANDPYGGLGFNHKAERGDWYGGQVLFTGKLTGIKPHNYKIELEQAVLGPSTMFARRFGSKHFFRLKLTKSLNRNPEKLLRFLQRPLLLCGFVFRAFYAKESNIFYVKTNEVTDGTTIVPDKVIPGIMPFMKFLDWHNPIQLNSNQKMAKYVSRFALGLSNSVPGLLIDRSNIHFIDDIVSSESNMTDGAGKINRWSLRQIRHRLDWEDKPTAIQVRVFGTKGLLVDDGTNADEFGHVELTPSQRKIMFPENGDIDPAHCVIDILRASHAKAPCRLAVETIINLWENNVPKEAFTDLLRQGLSEMVEPLLDWDSEEAMRRLWCNVCRLGGVMYARQARENPGTARAKGLSERDKDEVELDDEEGFSEFDTNEQAQRSSAWWGDEISGCPSSLEETIMYLIDSGFVPKECPVLRDKLHKFIKSRVKDYIKSYRIDVPLSASAFLVPDTDGILEEGEVFFKSSHRIFRNPDGTDTDIYCGDVLVTRHPCKLPTDTQKWKAVDKPGLHHLVDVIVLSTKGQRRAADWLAGGDYDGDKGVFIYQPELVQPFRNAPSHLADPPSDIESNFLKQNEGVGEHLERTRSMSPEDQIRARQYYLLGAVRDMGVYGSYSNFHEISTYMLGYDHKETVRLAHIFNMTLDGVKTGKSILPEVYKKDRERYDKMPPKWKEDTEEMERSRQRNQPRVPRPSNMRKFVMDYLHDQASKEQEEWFKRIDTLFETVPRSVLDEDLAAPYKKAVELASKWETVEKNDRMKRELKELEDHVARSYSEHRSQLISSPRKVKSSPSKGKSASFTDLPIEVRQDKIRKISKQFASFPLPDQFLMADEEIARIRASYAYVYDFDQRKYNGKSNFTRFPFDVAMRELCAIKARNGRYKTVSCEFYDQFKMRDPGKR